VPDEHFFGALLVLDLAPAVGLLDGLAGDAQGAADLGPGGSVAAGCGGEEISCIRQGVLGVSHGLQGLQGPLWASLGAGESFDGSADLVAAVAAFFGGHVNRSCPDLTTESATGEQFRLRESICDTSLTNSSGWRVDPSISDARAFALLATPEKKWPRATAIAGAVDGSGASDADESSL